MSEICENWIQKLNKRMVKEHRKIALLLDNSPAHPKEINPKLKNVTVFYLPPNTISKLQLMDQGVIKKFFKVHYRKRILRKVITALENNQSIPNINLRESISEISKAGNYDVTDRTIHNSFAKAGFLVCSENSESTEDGDDIPLEEMKKIWIQLKEKQEIMNSVLLDDFFFFDSETETSGSLTESDIWNSVTNKNSTAMDCKVTKMKMMIMQKSINLRMMK
ncbi:tigger transposable element-derived protein 4 [Nephila pilipes]|uniref:Tigger transposable element-derived protein 4 n=1 Tax=Nephila pilipes TaxID=299642 RepID=A0A8X6QMY7_NEPPI|nr:tigger transposable element-derived protein 4 [Nephila pilipes]